jgi:hypothetical protein
VQLTSPFTADGHGSAPGEQHVVAVVGLTFGDDQRTGVNRLDAGSLRELGERAGPDRRQQRRPPAL